MIATGAPEVRKAAIMSRNGRPTAKTSLRYELWQRDISENRSPTHHEPQNCHGRADGISEQNGRDSPEHPHSSHFRIHARPEFG
ncbi:MAG: hypothetical protein RLZZ458_1004 [Planctomycetota bacterium]|jgi:hypothetical protein